MSSQLATKADQLAASSEEYGFTCFMSLPPEVRRMIWELTLPTSPRVFVVAGRFRYQADNTKCLVAQRSLTDRALPAPAISRVCHEARQIVEQRGGRWRLLESRNHSGATSCQWTWFDPSIDVLCVGEWAYDFEAPTHRRTNYDLDAWSKDTTSICVGLESLSCHPIFQPSVLAFVLTDRSRWPKLKNHLFFYDEIYIHLSKTAFREQTLFTEGNSTVLIDARDHEKVGYCHELWLKEDKRARQRMSRFHMVFASLADPSSMYVELRYKNLRNKWLHAHYSALPDRHEVLEDRSVFLPDSNNPSLPRFNQDHPWAREKLAKMPNYQLVLVVRLCQVMGKNCSNFA